MMNKAIIAAIVLVVAFLAGFVPQYAKVNHLDSELRQARQTCTSAELRDLAGHAYVQANQKNYGIAAGIAARFFNRVREVANQTPDANVRKTIRGSPHFSRQDHGRVGERRSWRDGRSSGPLRENPESHRRFRRSIG